MGVNLSDVPDRYDVVFQLNDGTKYGFLLADSVESNLPFRTHKALYSYSPTFLERQNVSQQYGDNFQDFFLTGSQDDFSLGEQQKFFRVNDAERQRRYFAGLNVDPTTIPGNVTLTRQLVSASSASTTSNFVASPATAGIGGDWVGCDTTNLYTLVSSGSLTNVGAHGLGASTGSTFVSVDQKNTYISGEGGGSVGIRKWDGSAFTTFSSTKVSQTIYLNNILFGYQASTDSLLSFDSTGSPTTQFQWKNADGSVLTTGPFRGFVAYGGSLFIVRRTTQGELWTYDGSGVRLLGKFPNDFSPAAPVVTNGIVFVPGNKLEGSGGTRSQIYYYVNGTIGKLWESQSLGSGISPAAPFGDGILWQDKATSTSPILQYDIATGGVHAVATIPGAAIANMVTSNFSSSVLFATGQANTNIYNASASYASTGYVQTSQYDFDNTLPKVIRGLKVDADIPANTSVDIAYQLDGCGGTYTTLQTGVTSGTEYLLPASTSAHSISVQVTLNSATGSATPTLKRVYVRAAPTLQQFRRREFLFDLSGGLREEIGKSARRNRDNTPYPYDPKTAANNLRTIATQTVPFTVQDRFDQFTCIADLQENSEGYDGFAIYEIRPDVFIGRINLREV